MSPQRGASLRMAAVAANEITNAGARHAAKYTSMIADRDKADRGSAATGKPRRLAAGYGPTHTCHRLNCQRYDFSLAQPVTGREEQTDVFIAQRETSTYSVPILPAKTVNHPETV